MSLPLRQSDLARQSFLSTTAMLPPCVLVVDDHEESRTIARLVLERAGFRVAEASTGNEGLRLASGEDPAPAGRSKWFELIVNLKSPDPPRWRYCCRCLTVPSLSTRELIG